MFDQNPMPNAEQDVHFDMKSYLIRAWVYKGVDTTLAFVHIHIYGRGSFVGAIAWPRLIFERLSTFGYMFAHAGAGL